MGRNGFYINKKFMPTPKTWAELSENQKRKIFDFLAREVGTKESHYQTRIRIFFSFFGYWKAFWLKVVILPLASDVDRLDLLALTDWVYEQTVKENPFPKQKGLYGFRSLEDLTVGEYGQIDALLHDLGENPENLDKILAILYRPWNGKSQKDKDFKGDYRVKFNASNPYLSLEKVKKFSSGVKLGIIRFLIYQKNLLPDLYPRVFEGTSTGAYDYMGWTKVVRALSPTVIDYDKVQEVSLLDALFEISERIAEQEKI